MARSSQARTGLGVFDEQGEMRNVWKRTPQPGLWFTWEASPTPASSQVPRHADLDGPVNRPASYVRAEPHRRP